MYTVFIVDDEPLIREGLRKLVDWEALGYSVIGDTASAEEALEPIIALKPDLLITDVKLPGVSGINMIHTLRQRGFQGEIFVISGYEDFSYAKGAIRHGVKSYLIKPIDERELIGELYALKKVLAEKHAESNNASDVSASHQWFEFLHRQKDLPSTLCSKVIAKLTADNCFYIILLTVADNEKSALFETHMTDLISSLDPHRFLLLYKSISQAVILSTQPYNYLKSSLNNIINLSRQKNFELNCIVGDPVCNIADLPESFASAQGLWNRRFLFSNDNHIWFNESMDEVGAFDANASILADKTLQLLLCNSKEALSELLTCWKNHFIANRSDEIVVKIAFSNFMQQMLVNLASRYPELDSELTDFQSMVQYVYLSGNIHELTSYIQDRLFAISNVLSSSLPDAPMLRALDYIEHHYMDKLTVESIAQALHYNSAYFGRKFKSYVGESFQTYLEKLRLEKAKRLLVEGYKIYKVSALVGFSSVDYFTVKFRQYTSITPSQYRQLHLSGDP